MLYPLVISSTFPGCTFLLEYFIFCPVLKLIILRFLQKLFKWCVSKLASYKFDLVFLVTEKNCHYFDLSCNPDFCHSYGGHPICLRARYVRCVLACVQMNASY